MTRLAMAQAQWTTVDNFQFAQGFSSAGVGLGTNQFGDIIAVGRGVTDASGTTVGVTRQSQDLGGTWPSQLSGAFTYPGATSCNFRAVANDGQTLYAAGAYVSGGVANWLIVQSTDGGNTWQVSDSMAAGVCGAIAVDGAGNVFATGNISLNGNPYPIVRKLAAGGSAWSTIYQASAPNGSTDGIAFHPTAGVFIVGSVPSGTTRAWVVLNSPDGGNTWTVADRYLPSQISGTRVTTSLGAGIAVDSQGTIYATGYVGNYWVTRRSSDGGTSWITVDTFQYVSKAPTQGSSVSFDYLGNVYVAGFSAVARQGYYWIVRELPAGASSWQNSDVFQPLGQWAQPGVTQSSILSANGGHVLLVTGYAFDSSSVEHWITRRLAVP